MVVSPTPQRAPQPESSVRKFGKNSARWRSPAPGSTPNRWNSSSFTFQWRSRSPFVHSGPSEPFTNPRPAGIAMASGSPSRASASPRGAGRGGHPAAPAAAGGGGEGRGGGPPPGGGGGG